MYEAKNFSHLLGTSGFSDDLLNNHFKLYQGYVTNTNAAAAALQTNKLDKYAFGEVKRRFGWEFSGMRLHEYYFGNMKKDPTSMDISPELAKTIESSYGSIDAWLQDLKATAGTRGIGWVVTSYDTVGKRVFNAWINEHDLGHLAGTTPLLVIDVFEHAFILDYGLDRAGYLEAIFKALDWEEVNKRFR